MAVGNQPRQMLPETLSQKKIKEKKKNLPQKKGGACGVTQKKKKKF
jgi:hypothetical protein